MRRNRNTGEDTMSRVQARGDSGLVTVETEKSQQVCDGVKEKLP